MSFTVDGFVHGTWSSLWIWMCSRYPTAEHIHNCAQPDDWLVRPEICWSWDVISLL